MILSIIVAMADNRVIGLDNQMPWHLPADLAWFKKNTLNKPVIMGRKTFESIGRPLPARHNIIISRQASPEANLVPNVSWVQSIDAAILLAQTQHVDEAFIIGGGNIYHQALPLVDRLYLTHIDAKLQGDTYFPDYLPEQWQVIHQESHQPDDKNRYLCRFEILERKPKG
ncbi:type 3 dihydrofolate reductase [Gilliamella sp. Pra-s65]|uniref:type 3 dihydrofolate reductase n=1 Tax=unclassified Gilliamella TaxID=2685620 RepID=UPI0013242629|nr:MULTISPECIES: type 3 dihydrofolate reductase [unclassified Gilliamella]MWN31501.1 type 3 dihydrofolate reductase [Gilliamella sp. Pra-s60]MWN89745.1 type 3 dihydrofolate reductase [Gilliamella sp. Pra-s65]MWP28608.1 type 3 dihydrofolate reductase [Gilliamella sp. Pra-s54]MWP47270.1 type 3 dihydrofolate reductase [Gilliamella sp. Pas-s27]MWP72753.1 type 3 dihydrofolate reductase [Gilliamella sp. Pra-s52]